MQFIIFIIILFIMNFITKIMIYISKIIKKLKL